MAQIGYQECELVSNRAAVMLFGGSDADRRAWAEEAAAGFTAEGPLLEVESAAALPAALARGGGVVFVPDLVALGHEAQGHILRCLLQDEERPKLVLALPLPLADAMARGLVRDDVCYRLSAGRLDLTAPGLKEAIRTRRQKSAAEAARAKPRADKGRTGQKAKPVARKAAVKKRAGKR